MPYETFKIGDKIFIWGDIEALLIGRAEYLDRPPLYFVEYRNEPGKLPAIKTSWVDSREITKQ